MRLLPVPARLPLCWQTTCGIISPPLPQGKPTAQGAKTVWANRQLIFQCRLESEKFSILIT